MERTKKTDALLKEKGRLQEHLDTLEVGSDEYNKVLAQLRDVATDISKREQDRKDRHVRIAEMSTKYGVLAILAIAAFKFEEDGKIFTSTVGRGITKIFGLKL